MYILRFKTIMQTLFRFARKKSIIMENGVH